MRSTSVRNLVLAAILAALAVALTIVYASSARATSRDATTDTVVYVARGDIPVGVTGEDALARRLLRTVSVPRSTVVPGALARPWELRGLVSVAPIYRGEQVTAARFAPARAQGVLAHLRGTMRAIQLTGAPEQLLGGTLRDGDRVDVVAALKSSTSGRPPVGRIVLRNLLVLRAPPRPSESSVAGASTQTTSAMLRLSDTQARVLFWVTTAADWSLILRPVLRPADGPDGVVRSLRDVP